MPGLQIPVLVVGAGKRQPMQRLMAKTTYSLTIVAGFLEDFEPSSRYADVYPILGVLNDLEKVIAETGIQNVIIAAPGTSTGPDESSPLSGTDTGSLCKCSSNLVCPMSNVEVESFFDTRIMPLNIKNNLAFRLNQIIKRIFDVVLTLSGGLFLLPLFLGICMDKNGFARTGNL